VFLSRWHKSPPAPDAETVAERAGRLFDAGLNCTQAVLQATTGTEEPRLLEMAAAFGGGVGGSQCLCGAVSGGVMALGLNGKGEKAGELVAAFRERNRVACCQGLSAPYRWLSPEHQANCRRLTIETARVVERLLQV
jgi:C_GCAxxG_C_C family probable redox protein